MSETRDTDLSKYSLLSDTAILRYLKEGKIIIEPFKRENLSTSSYDVTLGEYYYRETSPEPGRGSRQMVQIFTLSNY